MNSKWTSRKFWVSVVSGVAGLAKGIFWSDVHALNWLVDQNLDFWYIEPQTDGIQAHLEDWQGTVSRMITG